MSPHVPCTEQPLFWVSLYSLIAVTSACEAKRNPVLLAFPARSKLECMW